MCGLNQTSQFIGRNKGNIARSPAAGDHCFRLMAHVLLRESARRDLVEQLSIISPLNKPLRHRPREIQPIQPAVI